MDPRLFDTVANPGERIIFTPSDPGYPGAYPLPDRRITTMGFITAAIVLKANGQEVPVVVTNTSVTLTAPMDATDHLLLTLDDGSRRILDPPSFRWGDTIVFSSWSA